MRLALDVGIPKKTVETLKECGFQVIVTAGEGQRDIGWLCQALHSNVDAVVSNDNQVIFLCARLGLRVIPHVFSGDKKTADLLCQLDALRAA